MSALSWTPTEHDGIYCAPACGGGCTFAEYTQAKERAESLVARLGPGWKTRVHENLGWHSAVIDRTGCWYISISTTKTTGRANGLWYIAFLGESGSFSGRWTGHGDTPEKAIRMAQCEMRGEMSKLEAVILAGESVEV